MLDSISIKNFQSLQDLTLEFGNFTVIVGASSSGKSALIRALKAVASNSLHSDNITRGQRHAAISVKTDLGIVTLERGLGDSSGYKITKMGSEESPYSKLNRQVPAEVTKVLGITPSTKELDSINFAGQFDPPYLLRESGGSVAKILGELTNVSTIFAAVAEASKRAKKASTLVNLRKKDREVLVLQLQQYVDLPKKAKKLDEVEKRIFKCREIQQELDSLKQLHSVAQAASDSLSRIKNVPEVPDPSQLLKRHEDLLTFMNLLNTVVAAKKTIGVQDSSIMSAQSAIILAEDELHQTLVAAGRCPTCNQEVVDR